MSESESKTSAAAKAAAEAEARAASEEGECEEAIEQLAGASADIARLEAEKADLTDRLLRVAADMENLRRRSERDLADMRKYAVTQFAADMLTVRDNLSRALEAMPEEQRETADEGVKAFVEGVVVTAREMDRLLEKNGVTRIEAKGQRFDPHQHQAMFEAPDPTVPEGTVVEVVQEGYRIGDRILRAAMVGVAKGGEAKPSS